MSDCKVIAVANQKVGCGKSATSTNLAIGMARHGKKVLVVDLDAQASQTISLGWTQPDELPITITTQLTRAIDTQSVDPHDGILHHNEGVDLMPSSIELSGLEMRMINMMSREFALQNYLSHLKPKYDAIVLDCAPTLGMITINALAAADSIIIPVQPEYLSVIGMTQLFDTISSVKRQINPQLKIEGVLFTLANMRTNLARNTVDIIKQTYGADVHIYPMPIPYSVKVKEASSVGKSIFAYDGGGKAAYAYEQLAKEVMRDGKKRGTGIRASKKAELSR